MGRAAVILRGLTVAVVVIGGIGYLGWIGYREVSVQMVLWQAKQFTAKPSTKPRRTDPKALEELRPRPWSSPLNNRHFDEAIAGARAAYDVGNYDRAIAFNTEALAIHPSDDLVWLLLRRRGDCYLENGEPDDAIADYEQAARLGDLDAHTYISRALALRIRASAWKQCKISKWRLRLALLTRSFTSNGPPFSWKTENWIRRWPIMPKYLS
jgi:tetratricopeptide (TPR) repeat protein